MFRAALLLREILNFVINGQIQMEGKDFDDFIYLLNGTDKNNIFSKWVIQSMYAFMGKFQEMNDWLTSNPV